MDTSEVIRFQAVQEKNGGLKNSKSIKIVMIFIWASVLPSIPPPPSIEMAELISIKLGFNGSYVK